MAEIPDIPDPEVLEQAPDDALLLMDVDQTDDALLGMEIDQADAVLLGMNVDPIEEYPEAWTPESEGLTDSPPSDPDTPLPPHD